MPKTLWFVVNEDEGIVNSFSTPLASFRRSAQDLVLRREGRGLYRIVQRISRREGNWIMTRKAAMVYGFEWIYEKKKEVD